MMVKMSSSLKFTSTLLSSGSLGQVMQYTVLIAKMQACSPDSSGSDS